MALAPITKRYTAAIRGLNTEGNALASADDTTLEEANYERLRDGTARRRRPIVQEVLPRRNIDLDFGDGIRNTASRYQSSYIWQTPGRQQDVSILAEESGGRVRFYRLPHEETQDLAGPNHMRKFPFDDELLLPLWGRYGSSIVPLSERGPCTYAEGDGSMYVFNVMTGTIRVDLVGENSDELVFTPIGTWVRDYQGAAENFDLGQRLPATPAETYNGQPIRTDLFNVARLNDELTLPRAYNLTNTGWPEGALAAFWEQSEEDYTVTRTFPGPAGTEFTVDQPTGERAWPALLERFLDGRGINEQGQNTFSFAQLDQAGKRTGMPPRGARVGSSDYHPAGSLRPEPINHLSANFDDSASVQGSVDGGDLDIVVRYNQAQLHSFGAQNEDRIAVFVHQARFFINIRSEDGSIKRHQGGFSGVFEAELDDNPTTSTTDTQRLSTLRFRVPLGDVGVSLLALGAGVDNDDIFGALGEGAFWAYAGPSASPHRVPDNENGFDYRDRKRPAAGAFFAGRLWQLSDEHSRVYYSQALDGGAFAENGGIARESLCYSAASPTDPEDSAVVATDGGYVYLPDSGTHLGCTVMGSSLMIFTDNGVFSVTPGGSGYFLPDDFVVQKITSSEVLGRKAWVNTGSTVHVATAAGILVFGGEEGIQNLTLSTIKTEYDRLVRIGDGRRDTQIIGAWDPDGRLVRWIFSPGIPQQIPIGINDSWYQDAPTEMLTFSDRHGHFYRYVLGTGGLVQEAVTLPYTMDVETRNRFRYLVTTPDGLTDAGSSWAVEISWDSQGDAEWVVRGDQVTWQDFQELEVGRSEPRAFLLTNHIMAGDGHAFSQIQYVVSHNRNVTTHFVDQGDGSFSPNIEGSTLLSSQWDWSDNPDWGKFSSPQETYRFRRSYLVGSGTNPANDRGEPVLVAKMKVRGRGREFRLLWEAGEGADSHIIGWSIVGHVLTEV